MGPVQSQTRCKRLYRVYNFSPLTPPPPEIETSDCQQTQRGIPSTRTSPNLAWLEGHILKGPTSVPALFSKLSKIQPNVLDPYPEKFKTGSGSGFKQNHRIRNPAYPPSPLNLFRYQALLFFTLLAFWLYQTLLRYQSLLSTVFYTSGILALP